MVTRNRVNSAFCTVIGFTVTGDYEFLGNVLHGIGKCVFRGNGWHDNGNCALSR